MSRGRGGDKGGGDRAMRREGCPCTPSRSLSGVVWVRVGQAREKVEVGSMIVRGDGVMVVTVDKGWADGGGGEYYLPSQLLIALSRDE